MPNDELRSRVSEEEKLSRTISEIRSEIYGNPPLGEEDGASYRARCLEKALNFDPETCEIGDNIEVHHVEGGGYRAFIKMSTIFANYDRDLPVKFNIVDIEDIEDIENGDFLKLWEDFVFSNIIRFRIGGLMNDYPVSFIAE